MAIKQRSVLSTQNTTLSTNKDTAFPDNNNKEITAADLRTWLDELLSQVQDILDSYFNKLDELRITSTLNYDIVATPTDWNGGTAPATQNLVNDELASRTKILENSISTNPSNDIAYVSDSGSDTVGLFEIGNPLKPFATIQAAIDAVSAGLNVDSAAIVKVLGGTYTSTNPTIYFVDIATDNIIVDLSGTIINGSIRLRGDNCFLNLSGCVVTGNTSQTLRVEGSINSSISLEGGRINGSVYLNFGGSRDIKITGGKIIATSTAPALTAHDGSIIESVYIESNTTGNTNAALTINTTSTTKKAIINNCKIVDGTNYAVIGGEAIFNNCSMIGLAGYKSFTGRLSELNNCRIEATGGSQYSLGGETQVNGKFKNCTFIAAFNNMRLFGNCEDLNFENCTFIAGKDCAEVSSTIIRSGDDTIIQNCSFFPAQTNVLGVVLNDASGYGIDTGVFRFIRNTYSKVWSTTDALRAIDYNSTTIVGLLPPPIV
jgi:hypothetical protein